ncbi:hypothetical protein [Escherichia coli]|uniref:hypothetical protein n=1 Tax=Escherichia coli TaxID=562 RepID=UPI0011E9A2B7|nr:hypothetical protein [Escherichia coli]
MMKVKIRGTVTQAVIDEAVTATLVKLGFDPEGHVIKGATIYFSVYDKESGEVMDYVDDDGKPVESVEWSAPDARKRQKIARRTVQTVPSFMDPTHPNFGE